MSFPRYEEYKASGVEWLGEIPSGWMPIRLKRRAWVLTEKSGRRNHPIGLENVEGWTGRFVDTETEFDGEGVEFESGDLLFGKLRPYLAKVLLADGAGEAVGDFHVIRVGEGLEPRFAQYQMLTPEFIAMVDGSTFGSKMPRASWEFVGNMVFAIPPLDEQRAIASFLDRETAKIDALVAEQRRLVELLKEKRQAVISHAVTKGLDPNVAMKPSGIEWVGDVPAHWEVVALKRIAFVRTGVAKGKDYGDRPTISVPYLRVANVQDGFLDLTDVASIEIFEHELDRYSLQVGDVLMTEGGDFDKLGRGHVWEGQIVPCITQNHVFAVRPTAVSPAWLNRITSSDYAQFYFMGRSKQSTNLASISSTNLMNLPVVLPPEEEQSNILAFIRRSVEQFDMLLAEANRAISLLQERRTALISAAVTGKIDVRDFASTGVQT